MNKNHLITTPSTQYCHTVYTARVYVITCIDRYIVHVHTYILYIIPVGYICLITNWFHGV